MRSGIQTSRMINQIVPHKFRVSEKSGQIFNINSVFVKPYRVHIGGRVRDNSEGFWRKFTYL